VDDAFLAIVSRETLEEARTERNRRRRQWPADEMLDALQQIFVEHGKVTPDLVNASGGPAVKSHDMTIELERCDAAANAQIEKLSPRTYGLNGVAARLVCTRCRCEQSHPCCEVALVHQLVVQFNYMRTCRPIECRD